MADTGVAAAEVAAGVVGGRVVLSDGVEGAEAVCAE